MMRRRTAAALALALSACATRTTSVAIPSSASGSSHENRANTASSASVDLHDLTPLQRDLRTLFTAAPLVHASWGIDVFSLRTGETLFSFGAERFLLPASTQKLLTTAVAAERLGWDYRFTTRLFATGPIDANGTLRGDLVVIGNGDPSINPRHPERWRVFDDWAAALHARGLRSIEGRIVGDDNAFEEPGWGQGWSWDNLPYGYGTAIGALQYNENQIDVTIGPAVNTGSPAIITIAPVGHGLAIDAQVTTAATGAQTSVDIARVPGSTQLLVRGTIATDARPVTITASVGNPTRLYVNALADALARHGISNHGGEDIDDITAAADLSDATELLVDRSPPLADIIDVCLKWSRNEYAETLLRALAPPDKTATAAAGLQVMSAQLNSWGIAPSSYLARDGSGLSRQDYLTAQAVTLLLTYLWRDPKHIDLFRSALPVAGISGTLATRMKGTPAENRVWAKTGTLSNVRSLSGYVVTRAGEPIAFSMIVNNFRVSTAEIDATMENALIRLVAFVH
jgi:serine-type D-Ala-D-Ala carboxypeptidase/endopeptidase (penicillin-binding protein 4)